jgi:hypothetical protein
MKNELFRSAEFWKTSIMTLPDNSFFELLRTVFGKIKTPFNKQVLLGDLEKFLSRNDIKQNIADYIDSNDCLILTAVATLGEPSMTELETFFSGDMSYAVLNDLVVNLEERFILYRFVEEGKSHLALNPMFKSILSPLVTDSAMLFPSVAIGKPPQATKCLFDDRIVAALLSFVSENDEFYRAGGGIRQKVLKSAEKVFSDLPLEDIVGGLQVLGLFVAKDTSLFPDYQRFSAFGLLSRQERMEYCAAAMCCYAESVSLAGAGGKPSREFSGEYSPWLLRSKARGYATFIHSFLGLLDLNRMYPATTLRRLAFILGRSDPAINADRLIHAMGKTGLLAPEPEHLWRVVLPDEPAPPSSAKKSAVIAMDTPFTLLLYPEIAYNDAVSLAAVSRVVEAGISVRFELNRDSAVSAFNRGVSSSAIIDLLRRLSHNRIDENLIFTFADWEKRHSEVILRKGLVLTLSPEHQYLAETRALSRLITETIAPGIYLLPESAEGKVSDALRKAGVAIIARRGERQSDDSDEPSSGLYRSYFPSLHASLSRVGKIHHAPPPEKIAVTDSPASTLKAGFHSILNKMRLGAEERDELTARIDRRLVLCESQLKDALVRYEKLEARGLDYAGKALIAKQAVTMQSLVEVTWPGRQGQEHVFGIPKALEKKEGESILVIEPTDQENGTPENVRIPLGKISMLRRIKKSIFETN